VAVDRTPRVRWTARVPDYDAFGREIGEDPLASLRSATNPAPAREEPAARPEPAREAVEAPPPEAVAPPANDAFGAPPREAADEAEPDLAAWSGARDEVAETPRVTPPRIEFVRPPRRRRRGAGLAGLLVVVAILGAAGLATNSAVEKGSEIIDELAPPASQAPATGLQTGSWLREQNFRNALTTLEAAQLGRPVLLRIAPDRINATLIKGDQISVVQIGADGELKNFGSSAGSGRAIAFDAIDPAAPEKLVRRGANAKHPARSIDYVLVNPGPPPNVAAYFKGGRIVIGDRHGRPQRVISS
jgi:hypothetical protein